ncbi:TetR/AcrR family transcriptional regulator [Sphingobium sp. Sx8-8]|uniref:TetR/AcrR family transcriptional regulator n=1 Tax=Sphingobium sp. Sx8-8 TaxID=2933617 RepID=UPI001F59900B|nr:TetR/AcrR family transcriptional regulator [Sphingobium sp. Sx8-8]
MGQDSERQSPDVDLEPASRLERPRQRARTHARIIRAARREFMENSYFDTSVSAIVKRAGVSRAVAYLHFRDKRDLLEKTIRHQIAISQRLLTRASLPPYPQESDLKRWVARYVRTISKSMDGVRLVHLGSYIDLDLGAISYRVQQADLLAMAKNIPAFRITDADGHVDEDRVVELNLIIWEAGQVGLAGGYGLWPEKRIATAERKLVEQLMEFIRPDR